MRPTITSDMVEAYSHCQRMAFLLIRGDPAAPQHDYSKALADRATAARLQYLDKHDEHRIRSVVDEASIEGLIAGDLQADCDALVPSHRKGSHVQYEPHMAIGTNNLTSAHKHRLAFAGYVMGETRQHRPTHGTIITFSGKPRRIRLLPLYPAVRKVINALREWGEQPPANPPPLILNKHCITCRFRQGCLKEAEQQDNLSLLERITPKSMQKYRKRGIFTICQLSYVYRSRRRRRRPASAAPVFNVELQALAIRTGKIYLHELPTLPTHRLACSRPISTLRNSAVWSAELAVITAAVMNEAAFPRPMSL